MITCPLVSSWILATPMSAACGSKACSLINCIARSKQHGMKIQKQRSKQPLDQPSGIMASNMPCTILVCDCCYWNNNVRLLPIKLLWLNSLWRSSQWAKPWPRDKHVQPRLMMSTQRPTDDAFVPCPETWRAHFLSGSWIRGYQPAQSDEICEPKGYPR